MTPNKRDKIKAAIACTIIAAAIVVQPADASPRHDADPWPSDCPTVTVATAQHEDEQQPTVMVRRDLPNGGVILHYLPLVSFEFNDADNTWQAVYTCS